MFPAQKSPYRDFNYQNQADARRSAEYIVPIVMDLVNPKSVVDLGCGAGEFLSRFIKSGAKDILGVEAKWMNLKNLRIPKKNFLYANLEKPLKLKRKFDLVVCLEVAEHLDQKYAKRLIKTITSLGPVVLFSAAIPLQGGVAHLNEQWPKYWAELFSQRGFIIIDTIREKIWNNNKVGVWYRQNTFLYAQRDFLKRNKKLEEEFKMTKPSLLSLVHPGMYYPLARRYHFFARLIPRQIKNAMIKTGRVFKLK
ncbi:MAG: class I SAM-dependent methyltransferase [Patescibacteria group bacterium]|nr:class I SAM-dependent methyltransferase [Patescibacteria group bacterium]